MTGRAAILEHVARCWASLFSDRAIAYRIRNGIDQYSRTRPVRKEVWDALGPRIHYHQGNYDDPETFARLRERRSVLLIAHRPELVRHADRVVRLENGAAVPDAERKAAA